MYTIVDLYERVNLDLERVFRLIHKKLYELYRELLGFSIVAGLGQGNQGAKE